MNVVNKLNVLFTGNYSLRGDDTKLHKPETGHRKYIWFVVVVVVGLIE